MFMHNFYKCSDRQRSGEFDICILKMSDRQRCVLDLKVTWQLDMFIKSYYIKCCHELVLTL